MILPSPLLDLWLYKITISLVIVFYINIFTCILMYVSSINQNHPLDITHCRTQGICLIWLSSHVYYCMQCLSIQDVHVRLAPMTQNYKIHSSGVRRQEGCKVILNDRNILRVGM